MRATIERRAKRNWAGAAGAWSARHRGLAVASWLLFVVLAMVIGSAIGTTKLSENSGGPGDSGRAQKILKAAGFGDQASEVVLVQSKTATAGSPQFRAAVNATVTAIRTEPYVKNVRSPSIRPIRRFPRMDARH